MVDIFIARLGKREHSAKDTLQTEMSDVRLDEVEVLVSVVVLLLQRADGVALRSDKEGMGYHLEIGSMQKKS